MNIFRNTSGQLLLKRKIDIFNKHKINDDECDNDANGDNSISDIDNSHDNSNSSDHTDNNNKNINNRNEHLCNS